MNSRSLALFAVTGLGALLWLAPQSTSLAGTWQLEQTGRDGAVQITTYVFKVVGNDFTGLVASPRDRRPIQNGSLDGNAITFATSDPYHPGSGFTTYKGSLDGAVLTIDLVSVPGRGGVAVSPSAGRRGAFARGPQQLHRISDDTVYHPPASLDHPRLPAFQPLTSNGLARTPPMGWNSWNKFHEKVDDEAVRSTADVIVSSGMRDAGYIYVNIDDTWEGARDAQGNLQSNQKFPDMKALADYVHSKGLKLGIYSSPGPKTCAGYEGSYNHEEQDARTWASWGIDYLKYDWCSASQVYDAADMQQVYEKMARALRSTHRPIVFSLCQYGWLDVGSWGASAGGNLWRTTGDISDRWTAMATIGFNQMGREAVAGPGHWNDPDMLEIGNGGMTDIEYRTHLSLWSMLAAPMLAGNDLAAMTPAIHDILTNREVIAIDQDRLGRQGVRVSQSGDTEVWEKPLAGGATAIALFNRGDATATMSVTWRDLGIRNHPKVRDLWVHQDLQAPAGYQADVPSHGVVMLRVQ